MQSGRILLATLALCLLAGCDRSQRAGSPPAPATVGTHGYASAAASAWYMGRGGKLLLAVWNDGFGGGGGINGDAAHGALYTSQKGDTLDIRTSTIDGRSGTVAIGSQSYDLSRGSLFLAYTKENPVRVVQLPRHPSDTAQMNENLVKLAETDPDIAAFIAAAKAAKPATAPTRPAAGR